MDKKPLVIGYHTADYPHQQTMTVILEDNPVARHDFLNDLETIITGFALDFYYVVHTIQTVSTT